MIIISAVIFVLEQPSNGKIINSSSADNPKNAATAIRSTNKMSASYFGLEYDESLDTLSNVTAQNPGSLEAYRVSGNQRTLAVVVKTGNAIKEESAYVFRISQGKKYSESNRTIGGQKFTIMTKTDGSEITAITLGQGRYVVIAYTSFDPLGNLDRESEAILASFRWL